MDAPTLSPYKFEVDLPESEGSGSEDEETDLASGKKFWYFYIGELQERPKSGTTAVYRFLIPHAVTPPEKQLESRTMSVGITDAAKRSKEGALVIRYCGEGQEDDFAVSFVYHSWSSPSVPVTRLEGGLSWTVTKTLFPLSIYVKVGVPLTVIKPSALRTFMRSGEAGRRSEKVSLLDEAQATGDVSLICKDGSRVPAHAAILASIPYFHSKLKDDWSAANWNMHKRLDVHLPCPVDQKVVGAFLRFAYGDAAPLCEIAPSEIAALQDLFSLAESTDFTALCENVKNHLQVTGDNAMSWLEWLSKEHGPIARKISRKVKRVVKREVKRSLDDERFWTEATDEQLAILTKVSKRRKTGKASTSS